MTCVGVRNVCTLQNENCAGFSQSSDSHRNKLLVVITSLPTHPIHLEPLPTRSPRHGTPRSPTQMGYLVGQRSTHPDSIDHCSKARGIDTLQMATHNDRGQSRPHSLVHSHIRITTMGCTENSMQRQLQNTYLMQSQQITHKNIPTRTFNIHVPTAATQQQRAAYKSRQHRTSRAGRWPKLGYSSRNLKSRRRQTVTAAKGAVVTLRMKRRTTDISDDSVELSGDC